nr:hypothetical protein [uncultured Erwinia sp.]
MGFILDDRKVERRQLDEERGQLQAEIGRLTDAFSFHTLIKANSFKNRMDISSNEQIRAERGNQKQIHSDHPLSAFSLKQTTHAV